MTTWTLQPSGGDYTTLAAALSNASTVANDIIEASGDWTSTTDTSAATVADDNITIRCKVADQARHTGFDNAGSNYELSVSGAHALTVNNTGCIIDGLLILQNGTGTSDEGIRMAASAGTLTVINSILRAANDTSDQDGIHAPALACTVNAENNMISGFGRAALQAQITSGAHTQTWNLISTTAWNNGRNTSETDGGGISVHTKDSGSVANINAQNCCFVSNTSQSSDDYDESASGAQLGTKNWQLDNCISSDASITARDSGAVNANENWVIGETDTADADGDVLVNDITSAPYDLRLIDDAANDAQDQHATATGAGLTIGDYAGSAVDIAGTSRPQNTNYDIGAFEVVAAVGGANPKGPLGRPFHGPFGGPLGA